MGPSVQFAFVLAVPTWMERLSGLVQLSLRASSKDIPTCEEKTRCKRLAWRFHCCGVGYRILLRRAARCSIARAMPSHLTSYAEVWGGRAGQPPNKRLKLTGGNRFKGNGVLCPWRGTAFVQRPCAGGGGAPRLNAIRLAAPSRRNWSNPFPGPALYYFHW